MKYEIDESDTRQQDDLNALDDLKTIGIDVDFIEPDGETEHHTEITLRNNFSGKMNVCKTCKRAIGSRSGPWRPLPEGGRNVDENNHRQPRGRW